MSIQKTPIDWSLSDLGSIAVVEHDDQTQLGEEKVYSNVYFPGALRHWWKRREEAGGRKGSRGNRGVLLAGLVQWLSQPLPAQGWGHPQRSWPSTINH